MEWCNELALALIDAYKNKTLIWNPKHNSHYNKFKKFDTWEEIAFEIGISVEECKRKMERLLSSFRRENMEITRGVGTGKGSDEIYKSTWFAYKSLKFILDKNKPRETLETTENRAANAEENAAFLEELNVVEEDASKGVPPEPSPKPPTRKRRQTEEDHQLSSAFNILTTCTPNTINDESQQFAKFVAVKLRTLSKRMQSAIQKRIVSVFDYETNCNPISAPSTNSAAVEDNIIFTNL